MFSSQQDLQTNLEYIREAGVAHMMTVYKTDNRVLHEVEEMDPGVWIMMTNPTMEESQEVAEKYDIDMVDVRAALDEEESSRIELAPRRHRSCSILLNAECVNFPQRKKCVLYIRFCSVLQQCIRVHCVSLIKRERILRKISAEIPRMKIL